MKRLQEPETLYEMNNLISNTRERAMDQQSMPAITLTNADFEEFLLSVPADVAAVVEFWSPECAPCILFGPVIERVTASFGATAVLAQVNVLLEPVLAERSGIEGVPTVKVFRNGSLIGQFMGALEEAALQLRLGMIISSRVTGAVTEGEELLRLGDKPGAETVFRAAYEEDHSNAAARLDLGRILVEKGRTSEARELLSGIPRNEEEWVFAQELLAEAKLIDWCSEAGGLQVASDLLRNNPADLNAGFAVGCCLAAARRHREALDALLSVIAADKRFRDGAARDAVTAVFTVVGQRSAVAEEYRKRLAGLLY